MHHTLIATLFLGLTAATPTAHATAPTPFPRLTDAATMPRAAALRDQIARSLSGRAAVRVDLCVAPDGRVADVTLLASSGLPAFDAAVLADARAWRFDVTAATAPTCRTTTLAYVTA